PAFHSAADVVPLILIAYVLHSWSSVQDIGILIAERTEYLTLANVLASVVAVLGFALLVPTFMEWGAAAAAVLSALTRYLTTRYFSQRLWPVRYRWRPVLGLAAWSATISAVALSMPTLTI